MRAKDYQTPHQAKDYHEKRFSRGLSQVNIDELNQLKIWLPKSTKQLTYLDLGSGTGRITKILLKNNPKIVYALDQSPAMIEFIKRQFPKETAGKKLQTIISNSHQIPLPNSSIDIITAFHLFKHLSDIKPTLREVARILKPGGLFIFDILNKKSIIRFNLETCFALSQSEISEVFKVSGLVIEKSCFLHIFGETPYFFLGKKSLKLVHVLDQAIGRLGLKLGTKMLILVKKEENFC